MKKRVADIVVETLIENGITDAFSVVGGGAMHLNNAFAIKKDKLKTVYNHHEQACAMAAEAYSRLTGKIAAVCVTSGPGGLNTYNGVQGAYVDSLPMIVIAGHPRYNTTVEYSGLDVRCIGVQENDCITQVRNMTKYAKLVIDPKNVKQEIQYAIDVAMDGRRGPVWISIPLDVQGALIEEYELLPVKEFKSQVPEIKHDDLEYMYEKMCRAKRPVILTGSGIRTGNAFENFHKFLEFFDVPIVGGWGASDVNYCGEKNYYGMSGSICPRAGNFILQNSDFILVLGNSLSSTQTGFNVEAFAPNAEIIMVDAQKDESKKPGLHINKLIHADLNAFFIACIEYRKKIATDPEWKTYCNMLKDELPNYEVLNQLPKGDGSELVHPTQFWKEFFNKAEKNSIIALGNSSCIGGALQEGVKFSGQRIIVNYHSGSMGIDLPFAIGAAQAVPGNSVYCVTGDGCLMMNLQELQTIKYNKYRIKIVIFNNSGYDNIRMTCRNYFNGVGNGCDSSSGISMPDFGKIAEAFEFDYKKVSCVSELSEGIDWYLKNDDACILEIIEKQDKERAPVIKSVMDENGQFITPPLHVMSPLLNEDLMKKYSKYI